MIIKYIEQILIYLQGPLETFLAILILEVVVLFTVVVLGNRLSLEGIRRSSAALDEVLPRLLLRDGISGLLLCDATWGGR